ncbi:MAG: isoprenylcysteine carboxylmethyltransferase family protein [DPANN group archaeon]|nr:isoprenylcysteine carboxylmethyltransferase family protein [DPANN group archaeon]
MFTTQNTTSLYRAIAILTVLWAIMAVYVFAAVKKTYAKNGTFTNKLLNWWFAMWGVFFSALALSALYGVWLLPIDKTAALVAGLVLFVAGIVLLAVGMMEFRTLRRSCAQDTSKLITGGIYRWSRNPQFIGCLLYLTGISLAGRSIFAFALTAAASIVIYWYTVSLAEPYLERLYGEGYRRYKKRVSRWFGIASKNR